METLKSFLDWADSNEALLWWLFAGSVAAFLLTPFAVGWILVRLPHDYFVKEERRPFSSWEKRPALRVALLAAKNLLGIMLIAAGLVMLVIPGQGLLTIAVGLILTDPALGVAVDQLVAEKGETRADVAA